MMVFGIKKCLLLSSKKIKDGGYDIFNVFFQLTILNFFSLVCVYEFSFFTNLEMLFCVSCVALGWMRLRRLFNMLLLLLMVHRFCIFVMFFGQSFLRLVSFLL